MLTVLAALSVASLAQVNLPQQVVTAENRISSSAPAAPEQETVAEVVRQQEIRPLPGQLDTIPVFNSNSPELVQQEGILLSTFPPEGMAHADAHLNYPFQGRFDIFAHHIARGINPDDRRTLFLGVLVYNPSDAPVKLQVLQGVSYLSQEAPFRELPASMLNPNGTIYAGPGSRTTADILRGATQPQWPEEIEIPPGHVHLLMNMPIPLRQLTVPINGTYPQGAVIPKPPPDPPPVLTAQEGSPDANGGLNQDGVANVAALRLPAPNRPLPSNGRTALMRLTTSAPVHVASLAMYAPPTGGGSERVPTLEEWIGLLKRENLAGPRDIPPSNPETYRSGRFFYGRVAGVSQGSQWLANLTDNAETDVLTIPQVGNAFSYVISTVDRNTFGTAQVQSAPMLVRYPDTAYRAHGNYGVRYSLNLPLYNDTSSPQSVALKLQTPLQDERLEKALRFRQPPYNRVFFRGTVRVQYPTPIGVRRSHYVHLVQRQGQEGTPLITLQIPPGERRDVDIDLVYPPDATPPQVITVETVNPYDLIQAGDPPPAGQVGDVSSRPRP